MPLGLPAILQMGRDVHKARVYNGFPWKVRTKMNAPQRVERYERGNDPKVCSVTGFTDPTKPRDRGYIFSHNEDYDRPLWWHPVSRLTHRIMHARFYEPRKWFDWVGQHYQHGAWFTFLSMNPTLQWPKEGRTFYSIYPSGLPTPDERWTDYADQIGLSRDLFFSSDLRKPITALWRLPERVVPTTNRDALLNPPARQRPV